MTTPAVHHVREHGSILAEAEKRLLIRIATRLPARVSSDHLTLLALAAMAVAGAAYAAARFDPVTLWVVPAALAVNWFGDSLDGTLARVRRAERPRYGYYVDHALDLAGTTLLVAGLGCSGYMSPLVAAAVLAAYLLVTAEVFLATAAHGVFRMAFLRVGPTELRILLAAGTLALFGDPHVDLGGAGAYRLFDVGGVIAASGLSAAFVTSALRNARILARLEPARTPSSESQLGVPARSPSSEFQLGVPARSPSSESQLGVRARSRGSER
jgi:archaetidylinositol phosphate synthase